MSQLESKIKQLGGHQFEVFMLDPLDSQDILLDLGQMIAPALGSGAAGAAKLAGNTDAKSLLDLDVEDPQITSAIAGFFQGLDKETLRRLVLKLASVSRCDGTDLSATYRVIFRGDLALMYQWLYFAIETNYGNFFAWATSAIGAVTGIVKAAQSRNISGGTGQP